MPDIPKRTCKICGKLSFGTKCRECYRKKCGVPISKYTQTQNNYKEKWENNRNLTIFEWCNNDKEDKD